MSFQWVLSHPLHLSLYDLTWFTGLCHIPQPSAYHHQAYAVCCLLDTIFCFILWACIALLPLMKRGKDAASPHYICIVYHHTQDFVDLNNINLMYFIHLLLPSQFFISFCIALFILCTAVLAIASGHNLPYTWSCLLFVVASGHNFFLSITSMWAEYGLAVWVLRSLMSWIPVRLLLWVMISILLTRSQCRWGNIQWLDQSRTHIFGGQQHSIYSFHCG